MPLWTPDNSHPGYLAGRYYMPYGVGIDTTVAVAAIDTIYFFPFRVFAPILVKTLVLRTGTGGAGSSVKSGIWADSPVSHRPLGAPLIVDNTGQVTTGSSTNVEADVTDTNLGPGWYWGGSKYTGTLPTMIAYSGTTLNYIQFMGSTTNALFIASGITFADTYSNSMPTIAEGGSFTINTTGNTPLIALGL